MSAFNDSEYKKYRTEAKEKWGDTYAYAEFTEKTAGFSEEKWSRIQKDMYDIFAKFSLCLKNGDSPNSSSVQELVNALQRHITENYYLCTNDTLAQLGAMYTADERFRNNIDRHSIGTAEYVREAIFVYCGK